MCSILAQYLAGWVSYLIRVSVPTQPFEIRHSSAAQLASLWGLSLTTLTTLHPLATLVVSLLQDPDWDVRSRAADSVTAILPSGSPV